MNSIKVVSEITDMQELAVEWSFSRAAALVPTMGFLHDGHLSLVREAARQAETVMVSIFINPLQFGPNEDFEKYPRDYERDISLLKKAGATIIFLPSPDELTPPDMAFSIDPGPMASVLCGKYRPGHFAGVTTIVMKLFQITRPGLALFGWKDAQQFLILQKMVTDLNVPVTLQGLETQREPDGLAMSSRNSYLSAEERHSAPAIYKGLQRIKAAYGRGEGSANRLKSIFTEEVVSESVLTPQYIELVRMDTLEPVDRVQPGNTLVAVAVYAGTTRLIDNIRL